MRQFNIAATCRLCGKLASLRKTDNGACGDPDCCGDYREYMVAECLNCNTYEEIDED